MRRLYCPACDREYDEQSKIWRCKCTSPVEILSTIKPVCTDRISSELYSDSMWIFSELIPVDKAVSLGEGSTPEIYSEGFDASFTLEYASPTSSFKDRGTSTMMSRAVQMDVNRVLDDSSGNAGSSIAVYAAHAGIPAEIYVPSDTSKSKITAIERVGARVTVVEGSRKEAKHACVDAADSGEGWYATHRWRPSFLAGTKTWAFELAARRGWQSPDSVVLPVGAGTLFLGAYRGFSELAEVGLVDRIPRMYGAEASGYTSVSRKAQEADSEEDQNNVAEGLHIDNPPRVDEISEAIKSTSGEIISITQAETKECMEDIHKEGFYVEPTAAVAPAALRRFQNSNSISKTEDVVIPLCGSGLNHW